MSIAVFRAPYYVQRFPEEYRPSWMIRPNPASASTAPSVAVNIYYKPLMITTGHMGFLGTY
jgi:hypothetical protein